MMDLDSDERQIWRKDPHANRELIGTETLIVSTAIIFGWIISYLILFRHMAKSSPRTLKTRFDQNQLSEDALVCSPVEQFYLEGPPTGRLS